MPNSSPSDTPVRDVDCVITARELVHLAAARNISLSGLPTSPVSHMPFPDPTLSSFLFPSTPRPNQHAAAGPSGGYLYHIIHSLSASSPNLSIRSERGRNADVMEYALVDTASGTTQLKMARFYGFRNIQNLVRRLKPKRASRMPGAVRRQAAPASGSAADEYAYVEVMACPGGCTNGGGQIKVSEVAEVRQENASGVADGMGVDGSQVRPGVKEQRDWLASVDEAYFSASGSESENEGEGEAMDVDGETHGAAVQPSVSAAEVDIVNGISHRYIHEVLRHWADVTSIPLEKLVFTSYREVESDVGKSAKKKTDVERVAGLASSIGGGW